MDSTSIRARFVRKLNRSLSDYCIHLCIVFNMEGLPQKIVRSRNSAYVTVTGIDLPRISSCTVEYFGSWTENKYGVQFKAFAYQIIPPSNQAGLVAFLSSKAFRSIGRKSAQNIVDEFGKDTVSVIENDPKRLLTVKGINEDKMKIIVDGYNANRSFSQLAVFLGGYGVSSDTMVAISQDYGASALDTIKANPYSLMKYRGISFALSDRIGRSMNMAPDCYQRIRGSILETMNSLIAVSGSTYVDIENCAYASLKLLNAGFDSSVVNNEKMKKAMVRMNGDGELFCIGGKCIFLKKYIEAEQNSADIIHRFLKQKVYINKEGILSKISEFENVHQVTLSSEQRQAIISSLSCPISLITGGPGTGKTTIIQAIIYIYQSLKMRTMSNNHITLLAPTGKAASRMETLSGHKASTIHSKLVIFDGDNCKPATLPRGLIIIDESSMVDTLILEKLLMASEPKTDQLIFLGDPDQLPSVGAGCVFEDMLNSNQIPTTHLKEVFRQKEGSRIIENAILVNKRDYHIHTGEDFQFIPAKDEDGAIEILKQQYKNAVEQYGINNVAVLSPLRRTQGKFRCVSDSLNPILQDMINPKKNDGSDVFCICNGSEFRLNDQVLQWKNNEETSNGDTGKILSIKESDDGVCVCIQWDSGKITQENRETMMDITLAYSISVHKAQGSEYNCVILPILACQQCRLFHKRLIYTAITRAKTKIILIGDANTLAKAITNSDETAHRKTLFQRRLQCS